MTLKKEYVEKEAVLSRAHRFRNNFGAPQEAVSANYIRSIPPADVKPVVRGEWIYKERHEHYPSGKPYTARYCSVCSRRDHNEDSDYCGYCGANMTPMPEED